MGSATVPALAADNGVLPLDVLFEVLLRLPADMLCRVRVVCRSWQSLTMDPVFAKAHVSRNPLLVGARNCLPGDEVHVVDLSGTIIKRVPLARSFYALNTQLDMVCVSETFCPSIGYVLNLASGEVAVKDASLLRYDEGAKALMSPFLVGHVPSTGEVKVFYS